MKRYLFVCVENANRSQMAEAFAKIHGHKNIESYSAGSKPSGKINPKAIAAMQELGYDLNTHLSLSVNEIPDLEYDYVVGMGCGDACPWVKTKNRIDWEIPDPKNMNEDEFREIRDLIRDKVKALIKD